MSRLTEIKEGGFEDRNHSWMSEEKKKVYQWDLVTAEKTERCVTWQKKIIFLCWKLCFKITLNGRHMVWLDTGFRAGVFLSLISTSSWWTLTPGRLSPRDQQQLLIFLWSDLQTPCNRVRNVVLGYLEASVYYWVRCPSLNQSIWPREMCRADWLRSVSHKS